MGLFDDIFGVVQDFNDIKEEVTSAVGGVVDDFVGLKDEAVESVASLKDEATTAIDDVKADLQ